MNRLEINHYLRDTKFIRMILAPSIIIRNYIKKYRFSKSKDSEFIKSFKNKYDGKRCFIIGNGPSLAAEDLELIKNEYSFACNRIYNIFDKTSWRPNIYMCVDAECLDEEINNIKKLKNVIKFVRSMGKNYYFNVKDEIHRIIIYDRFIYDKKSFWKENISTQCDKFFSMNLTVTCVEIEFAIYMGFKEIYLLGVDHNYPITITKNGEKEINKTVNSHFNNGGSTNAELHYIYIDAATQCYQAYKNYSKDHNISIYNATRGGKLEVFDRVNLNKILDNKVNY